MGLISKLFHKKSQQYIVTESIHGNWHYHISRIDKDSKSLCGKQTMQTSFTFNQWGSKADHLPKKWCDECMRIMKEEKHEEK